MCYLCPEGEYVDSNCACCNTKTGPIVVAIDQVGIQDYMEFQSAEDVLIYLRANPQAWWDDPLTYRRHPEHGVMVAWWGDGDNYMYYLRPGVFRYENIPLQHTVVLGASAELLTTEDEDAQV